jgi:hypothetical protein
MSLGFYYNKPHANQFLSRSQQGVSKLIVTQTVYLYIQRSFNTFQLMKNHHLLLLSLIFLSCGPEKKQQREKQHMEKKPQQTINSIDTNSSPLAQIKQRYALFNQKLRDGRLDSIAFTYDCQQEKSGTVTYFSERGVLAMVKHSYSEYSHFHAVDLYYVDNNKLYFTFFNRTTWSFDSGPAVDGATKDNIKEQRMYIDQEEPLLCLEKKYIKRSHSADNPLPEKLPNSEVNCEPIKPVLSAFDTLIEFKNSSNHDCLVIN